MCVIIFDSPHCNGANYHSHTCMHSTRKTGICIISPYPTPRDLRGRCLYRFNYSGKPGISSVWCVCPVAWSKTYAFPRLKVLTNAHTLHTHPHHTHPHTTCMHTHTLHKPLPYLICWFVCMDKLCVGIYAYVKNDNLTPNLCHSWLWTGSYNVLWWLATICGVSSLHKLSPTTICGVRFAKFCTNCRRVQFVQGRQFVVQQAPFHRKLLWLHLLWWLVATSWQWEYLVHNSENVLFQRVMNLEIK